MTDSSDATVAAVDRFNDAFNRHDVDAVMAAMTDDCVFESTSPPSGQRYEGQDQVRAAWEEFFAALRVHRTLERQRSAADTVSSEIGQGSSPTAHFDAEDVIATGDRCTVQWRYTWTNDDGSTSALRGVDVLRVRDGKVAEKFAYVKG